MIIRKVTTIPFAAMLASFIEFAERTARIFALEYPPEFP